MKINYQVGQRLSFIARNKCVMDNKRMIGKWRHFVGYVKQVRRSFLGIYYVMIVCKSDEVFIVPQRDIIGIVEKKDNTNNFNKSNINGNI